MSALMIIRDGPNLLLQIKSIEFAKAAFDRAKAIAKAETFRLGEMLSWHWCDPAAENREINTAFEQWNAAMDRYNSALRRLAWEMNQCRK